MGVEHGSILERTVVSGRQGSACSPGTSEDWAGRAGGGRENEILILGSPLGPSSVIYLIIYLIIIDPNLVFFFFEIYRIVKFR